MRTGRRFTDGGALCRSSECVRNVAGDDKLATAPRQATSTYGQCIAAAASVAIPQD